MKESDNMQISASILSTENKIEAINKLNNTNIDYIHFDIMDGSFVENKAFSIEEIRKYSSITNKKIDAHFMVENPIYFQFYRQEIQSNNQNIPLFLQFE